MCDILDDLENETCIAEVKRWAAKLCQDHPVYR
jgi:hypothetical protein